MTDSILTLVSSITVSGLLTAALIFLSRSWISQRLKSAIEHEYAEKLATYQAQLTATHEVALEKIKASNAQQQAVQAAAINAVTRTHEAAQEKRLHAIEVIWKTAVEIRQKCPPSILLLDIFVPDEYETALKNPTFASSVDRLTLENVTSTLTLNSVEVENARLYASEYLYALFFAYRAIIGRIAFRLMEGKKRGKIEDWSLDSGVQQLLKQIFSSDEALEFKALKLERASWVLRLIEQKMLAHTIKIISGEASGEFGLEQARKMTAAASKIENKPSA